MWWVSCLKNIPFSADNNATQVFRLAKLCLWGNVTGFKDSFYPRSHCESRGKLFLYQRLWWGLAYAWDVLICTCVMAASKTCYCHQASLWDAVCRRGLFQALLLKLIHCTHFWIINCQDWSLEKFISENFTQLEHMTNTNYVLKNSSAYWSKAPLLMNYSLCRKCSYRSHNFAGYLHWMKSRTRRNYESLYLCMGKDGWIFVGLHLFCQGMKLAGFNGLWEMG